MLRSSALFILFFCMLICVIIVIFSQNVAAESADSTYCLVCDGAPLCTIVVSEHPTPAVRLAALELQFHVMKITGAELPIRTDSEKVAGIRVLVGDSAATRALGIEGADFAPQEYLIAFRPQTLILIGRDWEDSAANRREFGRPMSCGFSLDDTRQHIDYWKTVGYPERSTGEIELPGVYDDQGTCYATYHFIEHFCNVRWYGPNDTSIILPTLQTLTVKGMDIRRSPALKYRDALWAGNWPFMKGQWDSPTQSEIYLFWRRLRLGGEKWAGNHTFHPKTIQSMFMNPAYQAQGPGRGTQLCYTHPLLVEEVAQMARDFFDGKMNAPEGWKAVGNYFAIVPDDNSNFCQCDRCKTLLASGKDMNTGQFSSGTVSNYFFSFVNAVAKEVRQTHPDKYIATLAYWNYALPPCGFDIEPNVSVAPCLHTCLYAIHQEIRENDIKLYKEWLQKAKAPIFLWNYYHHPMEPALIDKWKCFPNVMVHESARTMRMFIKDGIRGIFVCGEQDMLESYVIAKLWDDPNQDVEAMLHEFFLQYFGAAAEPMETCYRLLEEIACNPKNYPPPFYKHNGIDWKNVAWTHLGTAERMEQLDFLMKWAQTLACTEQEKQRVGLWNEALWEWMENGYAQYAAGKSPHSDLKSDTVLQDASFSPRAPEIITIRQGASSLESLAANEVRRYVYLRTGKLIPVERNMTRGDRIAVSIKDQSFCDEVGRDLEPQQYVLKTNESNNETIRWIVGGDEIGVLYGAYRFVEKLGVRFSLDEDILPDEMISGEWPEFNEIGKPRFALRGLQPFHDFSVGPDWWNLNDYQNVLTQMAKFRMNFIGFHTYPSWNPSTGPEANVWIGLPEDVDSRGDVRFGYEAGVVTTRRGWAVKPFPTGQYASGAGLLFESDDYAPDFMQGCLDWPQTEEAVISMFNRYGDFQQRIFNQARRLNIKTAIGTELPLGIPKELAARLESKGMKPDDPKMISRLYEGTFLRIMRKMPIDYYWLWTPEVWLGMEPGCQGWEMTTRENTERDLILAEAAAQSVEAPFGLATCGWRLGTRDDALWIDQRTPKRWPMSSLNTGVGGDPVEKHYETIQNRPKWVICWAEDDSTAGAHCCTCWDLQFWIERIMVNSSDAFRYGCEGMLAIHWRTAAISPNIMALARAGWDFGDNAYVSTVDGIMPGMDDYWKKWGRDVFGGDAGAEAGRIMQQFDGSHPHINALISAGAKTSDASISEFFLPLRELESLRSRIQGTGNLDRFDYWLNFIRATQLRVRTWVMADHLSAKMNEVKAIEDANDKRRFVREKILPLRIEITRNYEYMIEAFVNCAKSPGEVGTISSIESGSRAQIVFTHDVAITEIRGEPLPPETIINTAHRGEPRIFVSSKCSQMNVNEPYEIRVFVLSHQKSVGVNLYWRSLGEGAFQKTIAALRNRQAYRVILPVQSQGAVEYYLEAVLDDGRKILWPSTAPSINQTLVVW